MSSSTSFTQDFLKYALTACISFGASLLYTNYRLAPGHNVTLLPLSVTLSKSNVACIVNKANLTAAIERIKSTTSQAAGVVPLQPKTDSYDFYLKILSSSELVLKEFVPPQFLPDLEKDKILSCDQKADPGAGVTVETAALLDQPTRYLMRRSCSLSYNGSNIPVRASADTKSTEYGAIEPDTLLIGETSNIIFYLDKKDSGEAAKSKFAELLQELREKPVELSIRCRVIASDSEVEIGGRPYAVRALIPSQ